MTGEQFDALHRVEKLLTEASCALLNLMGSGVVPKPAHTLESVYGDNLRSAPAGWRFKMEERILAGHRSIIEPAFRIPHPDEHWMRPDGTVSECVGGMDEPRLILVKCKRLVFDILDENRQARPGEWTQIRKGGRVLEDAPNGYCLCDYILSAPRVEE